MKSDTRGPSNSRRTLVKVGRRKLVRIARRLTLQRLTTPMALWYASLGVLIGATTHVAWDSFTHKTGYVVSHWPILRTPVFEIGTRTFRLFEVFQHASTALGVLILVFAYLRWWRRLDLGTSPHRNTADKWRCRLLATIAMTSLLVGLPVAYLASVSSLGGTNVMLFIVRYVICCTTVFTIALCVTSLIVARWFNDSKIAT